MATSCIVTKPQIHSPLLYKSAQILTCATTYSNKILAHGSQIYYLITTVESTIQFPCDKCKESQGHVHLAYEHSLYAHFENATCVFHVSAHSPFEMLPKQNLKNLSLTEKVPAVNIVTYPSSTSTHFQLLKT